MKNFYLSRLPDGTIHIEDSTGVPVEAYKFTGGYAQPGPGGDMQVVSGPVDTDEFLSPKHGSFAVRHGLYRTEIARRRYDPDDQRSAVAEIMRRKKEVTEWLARVRARSWKILLTGE